VSSRNLTSQIARGQGRFATVPAAMKALNRAGDVVKPNATVSAYHARKFAVFLRMHEDSVVYRKLMAPSN